MKKNTVFTAAVIVSALGYFVDIYDLILFSIVRVKSLADLGLTAEEITDKGLLLINLQMAGMLIGGIIFGILGDKKGRLSILFGSIILYSIANLLNGFVTNIEQYAVLRFIAGIGLAGELGAGVTLVTESLDKEKRGIGTMIIAGIGFWGAVLAYFFAEYFSWRTCYILGGVMGLALLALRIGVYESGLFSKVKESTVKRGSFLMLFRTKKIFFRYLSTILIGIQLWYLVGILITLAPEFSKELGVIGSVEAGKAVLFCYMGVSVGDVVSGLLSQLLKSRKKVIFLFLTLSALSILVYFNVRGISSDAFYWLCFFMGVACGYWALFVTVSAEKFGTNLRATVATTTPNFVRGSLVPLSWIFTQLKPSLGLLSAGAVVGVLVVVLSFWGLWASEETFSKDMEFTE